MLHAGPTLGREVQLATIGMDMDAEEARVTGQMAHNNVREDGFFSVQACCQCLLDPADCNRIARFGLLQRYPDRRNDTS